MRQYTKEYFATVVWEEVSYPLHLYPVRIFKVHHRSGITKKMQRVPHEEGIELQLGNWYEFDVG